jgi:hypothetical protein
MARGGTSLRANGASRGGSSSKVKNEKIQPENNKGKQRAYPEDEEDDEADHDEIATNDRRDFNEEGPNTQGETDDEDEEASSSPKGAKRSRVNEDGDSRPVDKGKYKERVKTLPRDVDG